MWRSELNYLFKSSPKGGRLLYAWFMAMHTRVDLALYHPYLSEESMLAVAHSVRDELARLEAIGNCYNPSSELATANRLAAIRPVRLSDELYTILTLCRDYHEATLGCFDVTVHSVPYDGHTMRSIALSDDNRTLTFQREGIHICLSAFLKGYALDKVRPILLSAGIADALLSMGNSSILALGNHPHGSGWRLGDSLTLSNQCLTTSGNDTPERKHIISPATAAPIEGQRTVRVVTDSGSLGEALSTALFVATDSQRSLLIDRFRDVATVVE